MLLHRPDGSLRAVGGGSHARAITMSGKISPPFVNVAHNHSLSIGMDVQHSLSHCV